MSEGQSRAKLPLLAMMLFLVIAAVAGIVFWFTSDYAPQLNPDASPETSAASEQQSTTTLDQNTSVPMVSRLPEAQLPYGGVPLSSTPPVPGMNPAAPFSAQTQTANPNAVPGPTDPDSGQKTAMPSASAGLTPSTQSGSTHPVIIPPRSGNGTSSKTQESVASELQQSRGQTSDVPVIYGTAVQVNKSGNTVRGEIPKDQAAASIPLSGSSQDSVVSPLFVEDLARFLAENYWPLGTHPMAKDKGISTAGIKWTNMRYGGHLYGFAADPHNLDRERSRILQYVYMPSMIKGLYTSYGDKFFSILESEAHSQMRGSQNQPLSTEQTADMFATYSVMAHALSSAVRTYRDNPDIRTLVAQYADACNLAASAYGEYSASAMDFPVTKTQTANMYRDAVALREKKRDTLAAAMRQKGSVQGLNTDSLVYTALWLYRRGSDSKPAHTALAEVLDACANRLSDLEHYYRSNATRAGGTF